MHDYATKRALPAPAACGGTPRVTCLCSVSESPSTQDFIQLSKRKTPEHDASALCAPQVGLEPTTTRLTAGCSAIELLRNIECRQRPILPGRVQPSTFGTEELNCCVRYGNRWNLFVITTGPIILSPTASHVKHKFQIYPVYSHAEDISTRGSSSVSIIAARRFSPIPFTSSKSVGRR